MRKKRKIQPLKKKKHDKIVKDFKNAKQNHLEKLATKTLKKDEFFQKLKGKEINNKFLDLF
tara:strand:+ start:481 stop:663 length:183 start_codon:yes stop_codon:yes gene_type:complete